MGVYNCTTGETRDHTPEEMAEIEAVQAVVPVPAFVHRRQFRNALHFMGLLDSVEAFIAAPETDASMRIGWEDTTYFERQHPLIVGMAASLFGMSDQQLDEFFAFAASMP